MVTINSPIHETGWETLSDRRKKHKLMMFYRMQNGLCPDYLSSVVPPTIGNTTNYPLRNSADLLTVHASSQLYYNSFLPSVIREWNELPEDVRNLPSIATFKRKLISDIVKIPPFYLDGVRLGQIYHARLKTSCSSLNQQLFSKNILDSPLCVCQVLEDIYQFLFNCEHFHNTREELFL